MLLVALTDPVSAPAAAVAIRDLCDSCGRHMGNCISDLLQLYQRALDAGAATKTAAAAAAAAAAASGAQGPLAGPVLTSAQRTAAAGAAAAAAGTAAAAAGALHEDDVHCVIQGAVACLSRWVLWLLLLIYVLAISHTAALRNTGCCGVPEQVGAYFSADCKRDCCSCARFCLAVMWLCAIEVLLTFYIPGYYRSLIVLLRCTAQVPAIGLHHRAASKALSALHWPRRDCGSVLSLVPHAAAIAAARRQTCVPEPACSVSPWWRCCSCMQLHK